MHPLQPFHKAPLFSIKKGRALKAATASELKSRHRKLSRKSNQHRPLSNRYLLCGLKNLTPTARAAAEWRQSRNVVDVAVPVIVKCHYKVVAENFSEQCGQVTLSFLPTGIFILFPQLGHSTLYLTGRCNKEYSPSS